MEVTMTGKQRAGLAVGIALALTLGFWATASIREDKDRGQDPAAAQERDKRADASPFDIFRRSGPKVPDGTGVSVRLSTTISSEHARAGDSWSGVVSRDVVVGERVAIPAGSEVSGVVNSAREARRGTRAMLDLAMRSVRVDGKTTSVSAGTEAVIAGSPRARNIGAIAGGAAAGALIGKAVGGDGKDAAVGGILGGATAAGVVATSKGYQVVLKEGTVLRFTVNESVAMK
jgi:hypothetical protein